jgi:hypothetical protein
MNSRMLSLAMLAVNLGLAVTLVLLIATFGPAGKPAVPVRTKYVTNTVTQIAVRKINATNALFSNLEGRLIKWQNLESTDYTAYIQNLRLFGCPEETIRDIILTDIARLYAKRRAQLRAQIPVPKYWQTGDAPAAVPPDVRRQLRDLDKEQDSLVRQLLGVSFRAELAKYWSEEDERGLNLAFLPSEKQDAVQAIHDKYTALEEEIYTRARGLFLDEDQADLQKLQKQREAELAQMLSPEELEDYQIRNSETAQNLRTQLTGFEPNEEEFRKIYRLQKTFDDQFNQSADSNEDGTARGRAYQAASEALNNEIRETLGPERFAQYQRAQDDDYRSLLKLTDRFNLSQDVAGSIYDMKVAAERQKARIEADVTLSAEQRGAMIAAIGKATEQNVAAALGENVYKSYQQSSGQWLANLLIVNENNLALPPEPPPPTLQEELRKLFIGAPPELPPVPFIKR